MIRTLKNIAFINIRVAHEIRGAADGILPKLYKKGKFQNTLIVSPPGFGKTTLLRDLIRQISDGNTYGAGLRVGVVDERSELAGSYLGRPQNDLGMRTDVLDGCPKAQGMLLLLRSMSPQVIAVDELGEETDRRALQKAAACGCGLLATLHGTDETDAAKRLGESCLRQIFDRIVILKEGDGWNADARRISDSVGMLWNGTVVSAAILRKIIYDPGTHPHSGTVDQ